MNIEIKKLTPELAEEYVHFFDVTPHYNLDDGNKCYCVTWRSDDSYDEPHWFPTGGERREHALKYVKTGSIQGYLAYSGERVVGWCNTNANCQNCIEYLRAFYPIDERCDAIKIKPIFCFVIAPDMQRRGIATKLCERVCMDAAAEGFDFVEAYVNKVFIDEETDFRGPAKMYEKCGFIAYAENEDKIVMRKKLR